MESWPALPGPGFRRKDLPGVNGGLDRFCRVRLGNGDQLNVVRRTRALLCGRGDLCLHLFEPFRDSFHERIIHSRKSRASFRWSGSCLTTRL